MTRKQKSFDCVEMMHACQVVVQKRLAGMSREEELAYWHERHREALEEQKQLKGHAGIR